MFMCSNGFCICRLYGLSQDELVIRGIYSMQHKADRFIERRRKEYNYARTYGLLGHCAGAPGLTNDCDSGITTILA